MTDRFRKIVFLLLIPNILLITFAILELVGFGLNIILFWTVIGFGLGWFGALFSLSIPVYHQHLHELQTAERKSHKVLKEMHNLIGEHAKRRYGVKI